eukprot:CAMPEP_0185708224 /NCGR_PEP_ID=MMETSP1164-20130828/26080_1 /TAXON_ID=1104430 /ORGANISM="Chrysoreinhardia sp, Strain CCMP2950" /LENGTH=480 /DNA_ID=CAMNT_0028375667 /DNA_START=102 /DNA_END=1544 /DNA_ORIENTATION=-
MTQPTVVRRGGVAHAGGQARVRLRWGSSRWLVALAQAQEAIVVREIDRATQRDVVPRASSVRRWPEPAIPSHLLDDDRLEEDDVDDASVPTTMADTSSSRRTPATPPQPHSTAVRGVVATTTVGPAEHGHPHQAPPPTCAATSSAVVVPPRAEDEDDDDGRDDDDDDDEPAGSSWIDENNIDVFGGDGGGMDGSAGAPVPTTTPDALRVVPAPPITVPPPLAPAMLLLDEMAAAPEEDGPLGFGGPPLGGGPPVAAAAAAAVPDTAPAVNVPTTSATPAPPRQHDTHLPRIVYRRLQVQRLGPLGHRFPRPTSSSDDARRARAEERTRELMALRVVRRETPLTEHALARLAVLRCLVADRVVCAFLASIKKRARTAAQTELLVLHASLVRWQHAGLAAHPPCGGVLARKVGRVLDRGGSLLVLDMETIIDNLNDARRRGGVTPLLDINEPPLYKLKQTIDFIATKLPTDLVKRVVAFYAP